jgi:hypothetical protein
MWWKNIFWDSECERWTLYCSRTYGFNAEFDYWVQQCKCKDWYTIKTDIYWNQTCEKASISAYFFLSSYDYDNDEVIVYDYYTKKWYKLELKWTIGLSKAENFIDWLIVINMWTDGKLNKWDYFILNSDKKTTDIVTTILYVEEQ